MSQSSKQRFVAPQRKPAFTGAMPLTSSVILGRDARKREMINDSRVILETMERIAPVYRACKRYELVLGREALKISSKRKELEIESAGEEQVKKPQSPDEALLGALEVKRIRAVIRGKERRPSGIHYHIEVNKVHKIIPLRDAYMESEDPVGEVCKVLDCMNIGTERATQRTSSPNLQPIENDGELQKRLISYDGRSHNSKQFTYHAQEIGTTFNIPGNLEGNELLRAIDNRIFALHVEWKIPFDANVLEAQADAMKKVPAMDGLPNEMKRIATVLHNLVANDIIGEWIVPQEYRESFERLRRCAPFKELKQLPIPANEIKQLEEAFKQLDHPSHRIIRQMHDEACMKKEDLTYAEKRNITEMLEMTAKLSSGVPVAALRNLANALKLVSGQEMNWSDDQLSKKHFEIMYLLRKKIMKVVNFGDLA
ncbi:hypothetical protein JXA56_00085 [Candidatus Micrarchaeota archaeon]|nr:hypothetical protein [Candidatus Micrarchaeota archaeon]